MKTLSLTQFLPDETATLELGSLLARVVGHTAVIFLQGQLGAGKTTFSRGFLRGLGYQGPVKSPTYTLVEPYELDGFSVFHFDLYRLNDPHELEFIGIRDYLHAGAICLIEWPERGGDLLPEADLTCQIEQKKNGRDIIMTAHSKRGREILERFQKETF